MAKKILIVEDHADFRDVVRNYLEAQDFELEVIEADSGEAGILTALREKPDIILMDIRLPTISGIEAAGRIKEYLPKCKVIALTMFETAGFRQAFKSKDITAYIGKSEIYERLIPVLLEQF